MRVAALYRHPIKSFPAEPCDTLEVSDDGRVVGDRVYSVSASTMPGRRTT